MQISITDLVAKTAERFETSIADSLEQAMRAAAAETKNILYIVCVASFECGEYNALSDHNKSALIGTCAHIGVEPGEPLMVMF